MFQQLINLLIPFVQVTKHLQVKIKASKAVKMENTVKSRKKKNIDYFKTQLGFDHLNGDRCYVESFESNILFY